MYVHSCHFSITACLMVRSDLNGFAGRDSNLSSKGEGGML
jgi:hypothetical protein